MLHSTLRSKHIRNSVTKAFFESHALNVQMIQTSSKNLIIIYITAQEMNYYKDKQSTFYSWLKKIDMLKGNESIMWKNFVFKRP